MIRSSQHRWILGVAAAAALTLTAVRSLDAQQAAAQKPLPDGFIRQGPVHPGQAPKMTFEERTAAAHVFEVRFSTGDEILSGLYDLVAKHHITSGHITGIGGLAPGALLGWGDPEVGGFKKIEIKDKTEIVSLIGDISLRNGEPYVHVHMIVGSSDGSTKAGHLLEAHIAPVGELTVVATSMAAH
jgi:predicted DNA-binding protein with PD1-like motif